MSNNDFYRHQCWTLSRDCTWFNWFSRLWRVSIICFRWNAGDYCLLTGLLINARPSKGTLTVVLWVIIFFQEIGGKNNRLSNILDNGTWVATCLGATIFEILRISVQSTETWGHGTWIWAFSWKLILTPLLAFLVAKIMGRILGWIINDVLAESLLVYSTIFSLFARVAHFAIFENLVFTITSKVLRISMEHIESISS